MSGALPSASGALPQTSGALPSASGALPSTSAAVTLSISVYTERSSDRTGTSAALAPTFGTSSGDQNNVIKTTWVVN